jgi:hypothetical protein
MPVTMRNAPKHVEHPREVCDERGADRDHQAAQRERPENSPEQHTMLIGSRHREEPEQHRDDEHVVNAERLLDDVAR